MEWSEACNSSRVGLSGNQPRDVKDSVTIKSAKLDDDTVPVHLWDDRCLEVMLPPNTHRELAIHALNILRDKFCLRVWQ